MRKLLLTWLLFAAFLGYAGNTWSQGFKVIKVYDGDTIRVKQGDTEIVVRLVGVDAPEVWKDVRYTGQPYGRESEAYLGSLILDRDVCIKGYGYIQHSLLLGEILYNGQNINLKMLEAGLAEVPRDEPLPKDLDAKPYLEAEGRAKSGPEGMWLLGDDYVSPSKWRDEHRSKSAAAVILYGILEEGAK